MVDVTHGGTTAGVDVLHDCSTNTNAFGPNPVVAEQLRSVDPTAYPEPTYLRLRELLGKDLGVHPDRIVVGAGASELINRIVRTYGGDVAAPPHTFGEYAAAAIRARRRLVTSSWHSWSDALSRDSVEFLCLPNNPTGYETPAADISLRVAARVASGSHVVLDLAYAPFLDRRIAVPDAAIALFSPNKVHGVTGVRAAYAVTPRETASTLRSAAPSWVLGNHGVAMLEATCLPAAKLWVRRTTSLLRSLRSEIVERLENRSFELRPSDAHFLMVRVGDAARTRGRLLRYGLHVRDCSSFGLAEWIRISVGPRERNDLLVDALAAIHKDPPCVP
ncbi:MAG: aminotransferase class I/II-fold pyridoxal phosphate-dependent enzyme [Actinomycetota bacterium]|nr:aminotransferase class I/II-fold pyridoxal phosphate-dependent enzyme [Actinomycetota bacterium]